MDHGDSQTAFQHVVLPTRPCPAVNGVHVVLSRFRGWFDSRVRKGKEAQKHNHDMIICQSWGTPKKGIIIKSRCRKQRRWLALLTGRKDRSSSCLFMLCGNEREELGYTRKTRVEK